jgi:hypothetical protein
VQASRVATDYGRPEMGAFYRSDHFSFAKRGVPAVYMVPGPDYIGKPDDWGRKVSAAYFGNDYHKVSDEVKPGGTYPAQSRLPSVLPAGLPSRSSSAMAGMEGGRRIQGQAQRHVKETRAVRHRGSTSGSVAPAVSCDEKPSNDRYRAQFATTAIGGKCEFATKPISCRPRQEPGLSSARFERICGIAAVGHNRSVALLFAQFALWRPFLHAATCGTKRVHSRLTAQRMRQRAYKPRFRGGCYLDRPRRRACCCSSVCLAATCAFAIAARARSSAILTSRDVDDVQLGRGFDS